MHRQSAECVSGPELNRVFGVGAIRELAQYQKSASFKRVEQQLKEEFGPTTEHSVRDVFGWAQRKLARGYRSEYFFKSILVEKLVGTHSPRTINVFSEFKVGGSRADLVLVNGEAVAYEIKTELDDLGKACKQALDYYSCFKQVVFVVDMKHVEMAILSLPPQVGVLCMGGRNRLKTVRRATPRSDLLRNSSIFSSLHRAEYENILIELFGSEATRRPYNEVVALINAIETEQLHLFFIKALRGRMPRAKIADWLHKLPAPLWAAAYSHKLTTKEWQSFIGVLDLGVEEVI